MKKIYALIDFNPRSPRGERLPGNRWPGTGGTISIHAPRGGSDVRNFVCSVLPLLYFNPRSPRGERLDEVLPGDTFEIFQSTLPAGGATSRLKSCEEASDCISIHAPRGGSDLPFRAYCLIWNISIHAPRGGSDGAADGVSVYLHLISIHAPRGGSDNVVQWYEDAPAEISIHAPRGGSDLISTGQL